MHRQYNPIHEFVPASLDPSNILASLGLSDYPYWIILLEEISDLEAHNLGMH